MVMCKNILVENDMKIFYVDEKIFQILEIAADYEKISGTREQ